MPTYYKATFADGSELKRSTASRKYSHAWIVYGTYSDDYVAAWEARYLQGEKWHWPRDWRASGFCSREDLARKALANYCNQSRPLTFAGVAPAVEITANEYRAK
jgi:hypothetical protein